MHGEAVLSWRTIEGFDELLRLVASAGDWEWEVALELGLEGNCSARDPLAARAQGKVVQYRLEARDDDSDWYMAAFTQIEIPKLVTKLYEAVPNPFNPTTRISFTLAEAGQIELSVFDVSGRKRATLANSSNTIGTQEIVWSGKDDSGRELSSGVYFVRLAYRGGSQTRKLVLIR